MAFVKGQSGNPSGRAKVLLPDGRALSDIAKEHTLTAMETLVSVLSDAEAPHAARVSAAKEIFDRGWGRPKQDHEHAGPNGNPIPLGIDVSNLDPAQLKVLASVRLPTDS